MWVQRNSSGSICGAYTNPQEGYATEQVVDNDLALLAFLNPLKPQTVLPQDLMAQLTVADYTAIVASVAATPAFGLLWVSLQAQKDPMLVTNARFLAGWAALVLVLGQPRMDVIAAALGVTVTLP
jgi:hypothetical protein